MGRAVLATGGAGYIGSHAVLELIASGYEPVVLDDLSTGRRANLPDTITLYQGSVGDEALVGKILRDHEIRSVLHFAGSIIVPESVENPVSYYRNNTVNSLSLMAQCVESGVEHFVFSSTAAVYGVPDGTDLVSEGAPTLPISPYGASKLMTERMLEDVSTAHPSFRTLALRYFNVAGADPQGRCGQTGPSSTHLIRSAIETYLGVRPSLQIFGTDYPTRDGTCERDFIHVSDLAAAHVGALAYLENGGASTVINCGYGRGSTVMEVIAALEALTRSSLPVHRGPRRPGDAPRVIADVTRINTMLDWGPRYDNLDIILDTALRWQRKESGLRETPPDWGAFAERRSL